MWPVRIGVLVALLTAFLGIIPMFRLFMDGCFFEGTCGEYDDAVPFIAVGASLVVGCIAGIAASWLVGRLTGWTAKRPDKD